MNHPSETHLSTKLHSLDAPDKVEDSLEQAVLWICNHYDRPTSAAALWAGLSRPLRMTPALAIRALHARGLQTGLVRRPLDEIFSYLMPVILLDKDGGACVLLRRLNLNAAGGDRRYEVLLPEAGNGSTVLTGSELNERYSGHCLFIKPEPKPDLRAGDPLPEPDSHWLWSTLWKYKRNYLSTILAALMINVLALAITFFTMNVYDRVVPNQAYTTLWSLGAGVVLAMLFEFISRNVRTYVIDVAGKKADLVLGSLLFHQAMSMRLESRPANTGSFAYQLREFESVREFATSATLAALTDLPFVFLFLWVTHMVAGELAWVVLWAAALVVLVSVAIQWPLARVMRENLKESAQKQGVVIEAIEGVEALKAATAEGFMQHKWEQYSALAATSTMKSRLLSGLATNATMLITQLCTVIMIVWGVYLISDGHLSLGGLIGAIILSGRALAPLNLLVGLAVRFQQAAAALTTLNKLMKQPTEREATRTYLSCPKLDRGIEANGLTFTYPNAAAPTVKPVLRGVTLSIASGEKVAIIGRIGSGKSTMLRMLAGLYQPQEGQVLADGLDIRQIDPNDWRSTVSFLQQEPRLFFGTLRENVMMGRPNASEEAFLQAMRITGLDLLAASHPSGFDMPIGEMGRGLSGGQQQLVALARTLLLQPRVTLYNSSTMHCA